MNIFSRKKIIIFVVPFILLILVVSIFFILRKPKIKPQVARIPVKGYIAIVLDDWGYSRHNLSVLEDINYPLTISILPNLVYSQDIARQAHRRG